MEQDKTSGLSSIITALGVLLGIAALATFVSWITRHPVVTAVLVSTTAFLFLLLVILGTAAITTRWTRSTMESGAKIALVAQNTNDQWDVKKTAALVGLTKEAYRAGQQAALPGGDNLALPMPSQRLDEWLPATTSFEADMIDTVFSELEE